MLRSTVGVSVQGVRDAMGLDLLQVQDGKDNYPWPGRFVELLRVMMEISVDLFAAPNRDNNSTTTNNHNDKTKTCVVTFQDFKSNPVDALQHLYDRLGLTLSPTFRRVLREHYDAKHRDYKTFHSYHNPTLAELRMADDGSGDAIEFRQLPAVRDYTHFLVVHGKHRSPRSSMAELGGENE